MATLVSRIVDLATRIATELKAHKLLINGNATDLSALTTTNKANIVVALNELKTYLDTLASSGGATINDATTTSTTQVWSAKHASDVIAAAVAALVNSAPGALDTLGELAAQLANDETVTSGVLTALGNRVRTDINNQGLTGLQQGNARTNIDAYGSVEIGNPDTNFVTGFVAGLA